ADGSGVDFMIDTTVVYSAATPVPTAGGQDVGFTMHIAKSVGTTSMTFDCDFYDLKNFLSVPGGTAYPK
ncbi:MAG: hypothetical protein KDA05_01270, partial [Phycisphaerales bacterium]|nr:hypothetical protein [Phycisphaerales bacterium]